MNNVDKVIEAIKQIVPNTRPITIGYDKVVEVQKKSNLPKNVFISTCRVLKNKGILGLVEGNSEIVAISIPRNSIF